jgi:hypothetical protein
MGGQREPLRGARIGAVRWRGVRGVALDPMPRTLEDGKGALMGVKRERFFSRILARERWAVLCTPAQLTSRIS